jgi:hypothetical protein
MKSCCYPDVDKREKTCIRNGDGKKFDLPRRFSQRRCKRKIKGFTMRSSCAPFNDCKKNKRRSTRQRRHKKLQI